MSPLRLGCGGWLRRGARSSRRGAATHGPPTDARVPHSRLPLLITLAAAVRRQAITEKRSARPDIEMIQVRIDE